MHQSDLPGTVEHINYLLTMKTILISLLLFLTLQTTAQTADEWLKTAQTQREKKDNKSALKAIDKAISIDQKNILYYLFKAEILFSLEQYKDGYDQYSIALTIDPKKSEIFANRAYFLERIQRFESSIEDNTRAIELAENDSIKYSYYSNRAAAKSYMRDFQGAYDDLKMAYDFDSTNLATLVNLGAICDEIGKGDETLKFLLKAVEVDPTFLAAYGNIGYKYQNMGQYEKAIEYYNKVLEIDPKEPLGFSNRAFNKMKLGDLKGALKDINTSIELYPSNSYAFKVRALIFIEKKKIDDACKDLNTALELGYKTMYGNEVQDLKNQYCK